MLFRNIEIEPWRGTVRWYDPVKGFGFVQVDGLERDVLLHHQQLEAIGRTAIPDGAEILVSVAENEKGYRVTTLHGVTKEPPAEETGPSYDMPKVDLETIAFEPVSVKWYCGRRGFGFAFRFWSRDEVFFLKRTLREGGVAAPGNGQGLAMKVTEWERGLIAVQIHEWGGR